MTLRPTCWTLDPASGTAVIAAHLSITFATNVTFVNLCAQSLLLCVNGSGHGPGR